MSKFYDDELAGLGCRDGNCIIQEPRGMCTNGGCLCLRDIRAAFRKNGDMETWRKVVAALQRYRQIVDVLGSVKLIAEKDPE